MPNSSWASSAYTNAANAPLTPSAVSEAVAGPSTYPLAGSVDGKRLPYRGPITLGSAGQLIPYTTANDDWYGDAYHKWSNLSGSGELSLLLQRVVVLNILQDPQHLLVQLRLSTTILLKQQIRRAYFITLAILANPLVHCIMNRRHQELARRCTTRALILITKMSRTFMITLSPAYLLLGRSVRRIVPISVAVGTFRTFLMPTIWCTVETRSGCGQNIYMLSNLSAIFSDAYLCPGT